MAPHSSTLAWKIPWMEEPGGLQTMGSWGVGHDGATSLHFSLSCIGEGNGNPLQCSCLESPRDGGAWWAAVSGVAQSRTRLTQLSSSSSSTILLSKININSLLKCPVYSLLSARWVSQYLFKYLVIHRLNVVYCFNLCLWFLVKLSIIIPVLNLWFLFLFNIVA